MAASEYKGKATESGMRKGHSDARSTRAGTIYPCEAIVYNQQAGQQHAIVDQGTAKGAAFARRREWAPLIFQADESTAALRPNIKIQS